MGFTRIDTEDEILLSFDGNHQITTIETTAESLKGLLEVKQKVFLLDLSKVENLDLTFLQLLLSFNSSLAKIDKHLMVKSLPDNHIIHTKALHIGLNLDHHLVFVGNPR